MGNKCCSKRQDPEGHFNYTSGYKKGEGGFTSNGQKQANGGSLDSRYTPDPNRGQIKSKPSGVDIIRPRPSKYTNMFIIINETLSYSNRYVTILFYFQLILQHIIEE